MSFRDDVAILTDGRFSSAQKLNYLRYRSSAPAEYLGYKPLTISVVATGRCTLACDMCPTHSKVMPEGYAHRQRGTKDISFDTFKRVVDVFPEALNVQIIGSGEPLLNPDLFRMAEYAQGTRHMRVKTFSNGYEIDRFIDAIVASRLSAITVSVNSHDAGEFERMTGNSGSAFPKICNGVRHLVDARNKRASSIRINVSFIVDRANYLHACAMVDLGLQLGADSIYLCNFLPAPFKGFSAEERTLFSDDSEAVQALASLKDSLQPGVRKRVAFPSLVDRKAPPSCRSHFTQIRVDGEGRVSSCSIMLLNMDGNGTFTDPDVWNNGFFRSMRRKFLADDRGSLDDPCQVCPDNGSR